MRQRFAPSGVIQSCSPWPSESLMIFGPGLARLIAKSFSAMLVSIRVGIEAYQRIYQRFCWMQANALGRHRTPFSRYVVDFLMFFDGFGRSRTSIWCPGKDSNLHGLHRWYLKPVRLPIPPPGHGRCHKGRRAGLSTLLADERENGAER